MLDFVRMRDRCAEKGGAEAPSEPMLSNMCVQRLKAIAFVHVDLPVGKSYAQRLLSAQEPPLIPDWPRCQVGRVTSCIHVACAID